MHISKHTADSYRIVFSAEGNFQYELFTDSGRGANIYIIEDEAYMALLHTPVEWNPDKESLTFSSIKEIEKFAREFPNIFTLFVYQPHAKALFVATDLLGLQPVFYQITGSGDTIFSTLIGRIFEQSKTVPSIDPEGFFHFLSFGYPFAPAPLPYRGIERIYQRRLLHFVPGGTIQNDYAYTDLPEIASSQEEPDWEAIHQTLLSGYSYIHRPFIGVTAGKDSLVVSATASRMGKAIRSGNFGDPEATDVLAGRKLAEKLGFVYHYVPLCSEDEFSRYLDEIAWYGSGLATGSYVDMLKFVDKGMQAGETFVMGEAGESVRDFFSHHPLPENFLTPKEALQNVLPGEFTTKLKDYPANMLERFISKYPRDTDAFFIDFYRNARLPGNFGLRSLLLQSRNAKLSPFTDSEFIRLTYGLSTDYYKNSGIHRRIIKEFYPELTSFLDVPVTGDTQVWPQRFRGGIGRIVEQIIHQSEGLLPLKTDALIRLTRENMQRPSRSLYLILRLLPMMLFMRKMHGRS